jgi:hypothetical protein
MNRILEYEYSCVENFSTSTVFEHLSDKFGLDPYVLVEIAKYFAGHIGVPKSGFEVYVEPVKHSIVVPKVIKQVDQVSSVRLKSTLKHLLILIKSRRIYLLLLLTKVRKDALSLMNRWMWIDTFQLLNN